MGKRGPEKQYPSTIVARVDEDTAAEVEGWAVRNGVSVSEALRQLLVAGLK